MPVSVAKGCSMFARPCVYLIDDDELILDLHAELLSAAGLKVRRYSSSRAFLSAYEAAGGCECILSDLRMPDPGGLQLQAELLGVAFFVFAIADAVHDDEDDGAFAPLPGGILLEGFHHGELLVMRCE